MDTLSKAERGEPPCHDCRCEWEAERGAFQFIAQLPSPNLTSSPPPSSAPLNSPDPSDWQCSGNGEYRSPCCRVRQGNILVK